MNAWEINYGNGPVGHKIETVDTKYLSIHTYTYTHMYVHVHTQYLPYFI